MAERSEIKWENTATGKVGVLYVDGKPAFNYGDDDSGSIVEQPSFFFTHDRTGVCVDSSLANTVILKLMNYKTKFVSGDVPYNDGTMGHRWCEVIIDGEPYVVNYNIIIPREGYYENRGWNLDDSYNPDWYKQ